MAFPIIFPFYDDFPMGNLQHDPFTMWVIAVGFSSSSIPAGKKISCWHEMRLKEILGERSGYPSRRVGRAVKTAGRVVVVWIINADLMFSSFMGVLVA